jgi:cyclin A
VNSIDFETFNFFIEREMHYHPDPFYFDKYQQSITPSMRSILLDWMMEVSSEFAMKRETFHYSVNYVDRYLTTDSNISKGML